MYKVDQVSVAWLLFNQMTSNKSSLRVTSLKNDDCQNEIQRHQKRGSEYSRIKGLIKDAGVIDGLIPSTLPLVYVFIYGFTK